jgi:hypothetical protein
MPLGCFGSDIQASGESGLLECAANLGKTRVEFHSRQAILSEALLQRDRLATS